MKNERITADEAKAVRQAARQYADGVEEAQRVCDALIAVATAANERGVSVADLAEVAGFTKDKLYSWMRSGHTVR